MHAIRRLLLSSTAALAILSGVTAAQAEVVAYFFTADIDTGSADVAELQSVGLPISGELSGSLTYDTEAGWWGGSNMWADPSLDLTVDQMPPTTTTSAWLRVSYWNGNVRVQETGYDEDFDGTGARLDLSGQEASRGSLPSSLSFGDGAGGILSLFVGGGSWDIDLRATLTSLSETVAADAPELDGKTSGVALALLLGGAFLMMEQRRRRTAPTLG